MPCAVASPVPNSPIFQSPRISPIFCKPCPSPAGIHGGGLPQSPNSSSSSLSSSPTSPLSFHVKETRLESSSNTTLKRKRPTRLNIPVLPGVSGFGMETARAVEVERVEAVEVDEDGYSVYCKRGRRGLMQDRYSVFLNLDGDSKQAVFGVFDGHGGTHAAEFAAKNLHRNIMDEVVSNTREERVEMAIKKGYLRTDSEFLNERVGSGACCVTALILEGNLVVSNAGDCRAVVSRNGVAEALTSDHVASREDERDRIEALGGYVDCCHGVWRIQGSLAVTRGIGDRHLKKWVIAEPETRVLRIDRESEFLILASDGLWEKVSNQEAVDLVRPLCVGIDKPEPLSACKKLAELSLRRGSVDDISVMMIQLGRFLP